MTRILSARLHWGILFIFFSILYAGSINISGSWKAEFDTQIGVQKYVFTFTQSDSGLTGKANSDIGGQLAEVILTEVKLDSNKISFVEMLPFQGQELRISYDGIVSGNEMKLNRHVGEFAAEHLTAIRQD